MGRFFNSRLESNQIPDPVTRKLKKALVNGLSIFEQATQKDMIDFASKMPPSPFFNPDIVNLAGQNMLNLEEAWSEIDNQKDVKGLLTHAEKLLVSQDDAASSVLGFCIAVELSELVLEKPVPLLLENKSLNQLIEMTRENGGAVIGAVREKIEQKLETGVTPDLSMKKSS